MKKTLTSSIFLIVALTSFGQFNMELGLKGGLNASYQNVDDDNFADDFDSNGIASFHAGIFTLSRFGKFGIQPELLYSDQGAEYDFGPIVNPTGDDVEVDLQYISAPLIVKYYLAEGVNLQFGPQISFLLDSEFDDTGVELETTDTEFGLAFGGGWDAPFGLKVDARFILGLSDINDSDDDGFDQVEILNRNFQLSVGYTLFKFGNAR